MENIEPNNFYIELDGNKEGRVVMAGFAPSGEIGVRIERPIKEGEDLGNFKTVPRIENGRLITCFLLSDEAADALIAVLVEAVNFKRKTP